VQRALKLLLLVLAVVLLPACAEPAPPSVIVWHHYRGKEQEALEKVARAFEAETGATVALLALPYDGYGAKLEAAIPRGNGPDVFLSPHERLGTYLANKLVTPAGDAFPDEDLARYEAASVDAITDRGTRWAVPLATKCVALYLASKYVQTPPETLEELLTAGRAAGKGVVPLAYEAHSAYFHAPFLQAYGGKLFDGKGFAMVGPEAERAAERVAELARAHDIPEEPSGDLVKQMFTSGGAVAAISGPWLAADLPPEVKYTVVPLPRIEGAGRMRPYLTVDGAFLTPQGATKERARALVRYFGGDASAKVRAAEGKQVVANRAVWGEIDDPVLSAFHEAGTLAVPMPASVAMRATWVPAEQAMRKILRGDATPAAALAEAKARYDDVMRPPPPPPSPVPVVLLLGLALLAGAFLAVRRVREPSFRKEVAASVPAYKYVAHAVVTVFVLVVLPLLAGTATSFFAGTRDEPRYVGLTHYIEILTARGQPLLSHGSFYLTLLVTVGWTVVNVVAHVGIGLVLGTILSRPLMRMRAVYRVLLVVPWAVPSYVTALAWKGMFHRQFGAVNALLAAVGVEPVSWFSQFSTAFTANVATNVWLGFPFMMVVVLGALTSIPKDVLEAAEVDGATRFQAFRLVTLPLLKPTLLPAVVLGSVWTFNMFNVVFLVSGGEPDGTTDILVSEAYRWAFARNAQYGYAAAYAVIIFGLLALASRVTSGVGKERGAAR
jgi:arabinogalactan oligomer / maltooligosaccharide transport system permease protein